MRPAQARLYAAGAFLVAVLTTAACAGTASSPGTGSQPTAGATSGSSVTVPGLPTAQYTGPLLHSQDFPVLGISLAPPGTAKPQIDPASAYAKCEGALACPHSGSGPTITFARVTTQIGATVANSTSANQAPRSPVKALAYALRWKLGTCVPAGRTPGDTSAPTPSTCIWIGLVDATSGRILGSGNTNIPEG